jgi:hypothetical protein
MNFKTTYILFGALVLLLGVAAYSLLTGPKPGQEGKLFPEIEASAVNRVVIERREPTESKLILTRVDKDHWKLEEPYDATLDGKSVENMVSDILNAHGVTKGADLTGSASRYQLDRPPVKVTLNAGGTSATVNFGTVSLGGAENSFVYVNTSRDRDPVAIRRSSLTALFRDVPDAKTAGDLLKPVSAYRSQDLLLGGHSFDAINVVSSIRLKGDKSEVVLNKTSGGTWQFEKPAGYGDADVEGDFSGAGGDTEPTGVKPLLSALSAVRVNSTDDFIESVTDFKQYGLEPAVGPRIEVVRVGTGKDAPPETDVITVGKKDDKSDKVFVRPGKENVVAKVPANVIEPLRKVIENPSALRSRALLPAGIVGLDALDIRVGGEPPIELRKRPDGWKLFGPTEAKAANAQAVQELLNQLGNRRIVRDFPDPKLTDADKGFDKPSAVVTVWIDGIDEPKPEKKVDSKIGEEQQAPPAKKDEPKDKAAPPVKEEKKEEKKEPPKLKMKPPTATLTFGRRQADVVYVRREMGGTKADFAVPESVLPLVTRGRLDYLDQTLPSFTPDQATKLTFTRGNETWVVEKVTKDKAPASWVIRQPATLAGRAADTSKVTTLLRDLAGVRVVRLWAEKATDRELERFGLKPPRSTATVALADAKDKERTYQFGAETDDKSNVYAKLGDRDMVFSVTKMVVDDLQKLDLPDPTIYQLDLSKVTGMRLTGWPTLDGKPQTLDLERKGPGSWTAKSPPNVKVAAEQAEAFLTAAAVVRAEKVVVYKTGPKPEYRLTPAQGALQVEIIVEGDKEPTSLTIGGEAEGGTSYYAQSNRSSGDVFLVPKERFEKFKKDQHAFTAQ